MSTTYYMARLTPYWGLRQLPGWYVPKPAPVSVTSVEELEALPDSTPLRLSCGTVMDVFHARHGRDIRQDSETFPATILHEHPPVAASEVDAETVVTVFQCAHCGQGSQAHGMPYSPSFNCVAEMVEVPMIPEQDAETVDLLAIADAIADARGLTTTDVYGIVRDTAEALAAVDGRKS